MICLISFNKFLDVLPAFTCASVIGNVISSCIGVNILRPSPCLDLHLLHLASDAIKEYSLNNLVTACRDS